jgi:DNA-binding NarL/FixJ family response regulator
MPTRGGQLRRALDEPQRLGARPAADIAARRLHELEVLALLAADLRNVDIAARLHISEKTVDHHVSAVLAKLGVRSRREAARVAAERDIRHADGEPAPR